jgi:hypothetical protein
VIEAFTAQHRDQVLYRSLTGLPPLNDVSNPKTRSDNGNGVYDLPNGNP